MFFPSSSRFRFILKSLENLKHIESEVHHHHQSKVVEKLRQL